MPLTAPVVTTVRLVDPPWATVTTAEPLASRVTAELGTVSTLRAVATTNVTSAQAPLDSAGTAAGTRTTTGYVGELPAAAPEVDVGSRLTDRTVPSTPRSLPVG